MQSFQHSSRKNDHTPNTLQRKCPWLRRGSAESALPLRNEGHFLQPFLYYSSGLRTTDMFQNKKRPDRHCLRSIEQGPHTYVGGPLEDQSAYTTQTAVGKNVDATPHMIEREIARETQHSLIPLPTGNFPRLVFPSNPSPRGRSPPAAHGVRASPRPRTSPGWR